MPRPGDPADDEVLLSTRAVGVCGSEIHQFHNTHSWPVNIPVILGHEFTGVVSAVGKGVRGFREGDRVVSETAAYICGQCAYCRSGEYNLCPQRRGFGYGVNGAMADLVRVPARCLHRVPDAVSFEKAALTEPCCVAFNATCVHTRDPPGRFRSGPGAGPHRPALPGTGQAGGRKLGGRGRAEAGCRPHESGAGAGRGSHAHGG